MSGAEKSDSVKKPAAFDIRLVIVSAVILGLITWNVGTLTGILSANEHSIKPSKAESPKGAWRFIVSGDSRNCGDVVMPAIAAHSARFTPSFYWHLGDLRAISRIDEDMHCAAQKAGQVLTFDNYQRRAWNDFVENQIAAFGDVPFYLGI